MVYVHVVQPAFKQLYFNFQCNGKPMPWSHVEKLYKEETRAGLAATGLRLVPKLKFENIYLSSFSKMRVDLAAQVCTVHVHVHVERERDIMCIVYTFALMLLSTIFVFVHAGTQRVSIKGTEADGWRRGVGDCPFCVYGGSVL